MPTQNAPVAHDHAAVVLGPSFAPETDAGSQEAGNGRCPWGIAYVAR